MGIARRLRRLRARKNIQRSHMREGHGASVNYVNLRQRANDADPRRWKEPGYTCIARPHDERAN